MGISVTPISWTAWCRGMTRSCITPPNRITTTASRTRSRSCGRTWRAPTVCWKQLASMTCATTTSAPTRCMATWHWMIRTGSRSRPRTIRPARTAPPRRLPTCWCAPGTAPMECAPRSATAATTMVRTSMWRSSSRARSRTS